MNVEFCCNLVKDILKFNILRTTNECPFRNVFCVKLISIMKRIFFGRQWSFSKTCFGRIWMFIYHTVGMLTRNNILEKLKDVFFFVFK